MADSWQHSGSFVIRFNPITNPIAKRFSGRVEHVATGKMLRFESMEALTAFMTEVLTEVRSKLEQADTLAEDFFSPPNE
jgi:hypothetical protein